MYIAYIRLKSRPHLQVSRHRKYEKDFQHHIPLLKTSLISLNIEYLLARYDLKTMIEPLQDH